MASSFTLTMTLDEYTAAQKKATANGLLAPDVKTHLLPEIDGVLVSYIGHCLTTDHYGITFTVLRKPFYVSMDVIENHVKALIGG